MNKKILFAILCLLLIIMVGCGVTDTPNNEDNDKDKITITELEEKFNAIVAYLNDSIPYFVTKDIDLIQEYPEYNATISWVSSNNDVLDEYGFVYVNKSKAFEVQLTYTISIDEYNMDGNINVIVSPVTIEKVFEKFEYQFSKIIIRDYEVKSNYYDLFEIDWISTNSLVFDNDGVYNKQIDDVDFEIQYYVKCGEYVSDRREIKLTAAGVSDYEKIQEIDKWIHNEALKDLYLSEDVTLPTVYEKYNVPIEWTSSNPDVVSDSGEIIHYVFERYITLTGRFALENGSGGNVKFECVVSPLDTTNMSIQEILDNFISAIAVTSYKQVSFGYSGCPVLSQSYGSLYFYNNKESEVTQMLIPVGTSNRSQKAMTPELVVIHDTANYNASALNNAKYVQSGYGGTSTSWHYTTGNDGIYQTLPDNECGAHANGTNTTPFELVDTEINATAIKPIITIEDDGYIYINGVKTKYIVKKTTEKFADDGVICEIGDNGNYWISKTWYCSSHGYNANLGGNASGIGIESAVKYGDDYMKTVRMTAKLTAELLIKHNLTVNRVVQHNTMSGKNCPQAIREANYWYTFKDMVSLEKWAKENLTEYEFIWTSNSDILDNEGYINKNINGVDSISYNVNVMKNGVKVFSNSYTTNLY